MTRIGLGLSAGAWALLLAAGCASLDVAGLFALKSDGDRLVDGKLEVIAQSTCDRLNRLDMAATMTKKGEAFYISSKTPGNNVKFTLVLTREKVGQEEKTHIRLQWADRADGNMATEILARLDFSGPR